MVGMLEHHVAEAPPLEHARVASQRDDSRGQRHRGESGVGRIVPPRRLVQRDRLLGQVELIAQF